MKHKLPKGSVFALQKDTIEYLRRLALQEGADSISVTRASKFGVGFVVSASKYGRKLDLQALVKRHLEKI